MTDHCQGNTTKKASRVSFPESQSTLLTYHLYLAAVDLSESSEDKDRVWYTHRDFQRNLSQLHRAAAQRRNPSSSLDDDGIGDIIDTEERLVDQRCIEPFVRAQSIRESVQAVIAAQNRLRSVYGYGYDPELLANANREVSSYRHRIAHLVAMRDAANIMDTNSGTLAQDGKGAGKSINVRRTTKSPLRQQRRRERIRQPHGGRINAA